MSFIVVITLNTLITLFLDEIRHIFFPKEVDIYIEGIFIFCLVSFFLEFVLSWIAVEGYSFSFFFWLDFIAILYLVIEIYVFLSTSREYEDSAFHLPH